MNKNARLVLTIGLCLLSAFLIEVFLKRINILQVEPWPALTFGIFFGLANLRRWWHFLPYAVICVFIYVLAFQAGIWGGSLFRFLGFGFAAGATGAFALVVVTKFFVRDAPTRWDFLITTSVGAVTGAGLSWALFDAKLGLFLVFAIWQVPVGFWLAWTLPNPQDPIEDLPVSVAPP